MKSCEKFISLESDYYVHLPGAAARRAFFYPTYIGHFFYEPGYMLRRNAFDSFLLMYIYAGQFTLEYSDAKQTVNAGSFVLLDCYKPHAYYTDTGWESLWFHFDGPVARDHYELIAGHLGHVFSLTSPYPVLNKLNALYQTFYKGNAIKEPLLSRQITDILTTLLLCTPSKQGVFAHTETMEGIVSYIHEHYTENLSVQSLADQAMLSPYHFIRMFKKETGFTPHEYIRNIRLSTARYLLKTTRLPVKQICFRTGFSNESVFCTAFKNNWGLTPSEYRNSF